MIDSDLRASLLRKLGAERYRTIQEPGDWHWNSHHQRYQFALPVTGRFFTPDAYLIEMLPVQFELNLLRLRTVRHQVITAALQDPRTRELFPHGA